MKAPCPTSFTTPVQCGSQGFVPNYRCQLAPVWPVVGRRLDEQQQTALTFKEMDLLRLLARGHSNEVLAKIFCVSKSTVRTHLRNIYVKLGAVSRTQAVTLGYRAGLLNTEQMEHRNESMSAAAPSQPLKLSSDEPFACFMRRAHGTSCEEGARLQEAAPLTVKEIRLLQLLSEGYTNKTLAAKALVSLSTVQTHLRNIYTKLGTRNRTEAVAIGRQHGLIR